MEDSIIKLWMPVNKSSDGKLVGILSDTSMDRDNEFMSKELLEAWALEGHLKALANHTNKMENWVGGWKNLKTISKNGNVALVAEPWFFSKEANPLAYQIQKQVEEAIDKGLGAGISIGAIPQDSIQKEVNGQMRKVFVKAELVEATWVPIQSNRNATFGHIAKQFEFDLIKENKMVEEIKKEVLEVVDEVAEVVEVKEDKVVASPSEEVSEEVGVEALDPSSDVKEQSLSPEEAQVIVEENKQLKVRLEKLESQAILKTGVVEGPIIAKHAIDEPWSIEKGVKQYLGAKN